MKELIFKKSITLNVPVKKVWEALTKPEWTNKYMFNCDAISNWKKGGTIIWKGHEDGKLYVKGKITEIEPEKLLEFTTFDPNGDLPDIPSNYTKVTYKLSSEDGHTILSVSDGDFSKVGNGEKRYQETIKGWETTLNKLKEAVEKSN